MAAQRLVPDGAILCNYAVGCSINITMWRTPLNSIALATHSSATDHQLLLSRRCSTSSTHIMDNWSSGEIQVQVLQVRVHACVHTCARVCLTISRNTPCFFFLFSKPRQQPVSVLLSVGDLFELYRAHLQTPRAPPSVHAHTPPECLRVSRVLFVISPLVVLATLSARPP